MLYVIIGLGLFFVLIGRIVTEKNARCLLAGYNTQSEEERKKVDIKHLLSFFKRFHDFLGLSFLLIGISLYYLLGENAGGIFLGIYPLLAYTWFTLKSRSFSAEISNSKAASYFGVTVLVLSLVFISALLIWGFKEDKMIVSSNGVKIEGFYGEALKKEEILKVELVSILPDIRYKSNGFALGNTLKGHFKTADGESVKLILNSAEIPVLLLLTEKGGKIYYSGENVKETSVLYEQIKKLK